MRHCLFIAVLLFSSTTFAQNYKVGDRVVVIKINAPIMDGEKQVDTLSAGLRLEVRKVNASGWLNVARVRPGWIWHKNVVPVKRALDYLTRMVERYPTDGHWLYGRARVWMDKGELEMAIADYSELIRLLPEQSEVWVCRGDAWRRKQEYDKAIEDLNEGIRLDPTRTVYFNHRGLAWSGKQEHDKSIQDYNEAIRLDPKYATPYNNRGVEWKRKQEYDKAIQDYNEAIRLDPKNAGAYNSTAWLLATCPDAKYRDGKKAVENARKACNLLNWKSESALDTLAAAYAESGHFEQAIECQNKAIELAPKKEKDDYRTRLELYKSGKPYRDVPN